MTNLILSLVLLLGVGTIYGCVKMAQANPEIIAGFKMSDDPEQEKRDQAWLKLFLRNMHAANIVTLAGGIVGIVCDLLVVYCLSFVLPITTAVLLSYSRRKRICRRDGFEEAQEEA